MAAILGVVCARKGSKRLKDKNLRLIDGLSLVERAVQTLSKSDVEDIAVVTDFTPDFDLDKYGAKQILRSANISGDNVPLQETVKWACYSLDKSYDYIIFLMPNCPLISIEAVREALKLIIDNRLNVVRSYNTDGKENGLVAVRTRYLMDHFIDVYCGCVVLQGDEIHDEADFMRVKEAMESCRDDMEQR